MWIVFQYPIRHRTRVANLWLNYQFSRKNVGILCRWQFCVIFRAVNTMFMFPNINEGINCKNFPVAALPASRPTRNSLYESNQTFQPRSCFAWILTNMQYYFPNHWSMQIFSYSCRKTLILKRSLSLRNTSIYIWSKKRVWVLEFLMYETKAFLNFEAKMFFSPIQADVGFLACWCLIQKCLN